MSNLKFFDDPMLGVEPTAINLGLNANIGVNVNIYINADIGINLYASINVDVIESK